VSNPQAALTSRLPKASFQTVSPLHRVTQKRNLKTVKMNGSTDLNEARTSCVAHVQARAEHFSVWLIRYTENVKYWHFSSILPTFSK
jgi:hypothetical protein